MRLSRNAAVPSRPSAELRCIQPSCDSWAIWRASSFRLLAPKKLSLVALIAPGAPRKMASSTSPSRASMSAAATISCTSPMRTASAAPKRSPVNA